MSYQTQAGMSKQDYQKYLTSDHWKKTRAAALERGANKCALCGDEDNLDVHHNSYEGLGSELDTDLVVLCRKHHTLVHSLDIASLSDEPTAWRYGLGIFARDMEACYSISEILSCAFAWKEHVDSFGNGRLALPGMKKSCTEAIVKEAGLSIRRKVDDLLDIYMETGRKSMSLVTKTRMDAEVLV